MEEDGVDVHIRHGAIFDSPSTDRKDRKNFKEVDRFHVWSFLFESRFEVQAKQLWLEGYDFSVKYQPASWNWQTGGGSNEQLEIRRGGQLPTVSMIERVRFLGGVS